MKFNPVAYGLIPHFRNLFQSVNCRTQFLTLVTLWPTQKGAMNICGFFPFVFSRVTFVIRRYFAQYGLCDRPTLRATQPWRAILPSIQTLWQAIRRSVQTLWQADRSPNTDLAKGLSFAQYTQCYRPILCPMQTLWQADRSPNTHIVTGRSFTQADTPNIYKHDSERRITGGPRAQRPLTTNNRIHTHMHTRQSARKSS